MTAPARFCPEDNSATDLPFRYRPDKTTASAYRHDPRGQQSAVMIAAEETAFEAFVEEKIGFLEMADVAEAVMDEMTGWGGVV